MLFDPGTDNSCFYFDGAQSAFSAAVFTNKFLRAPQDASISTSGRTIVSFLIVVKIFYLKLFWKKHLNVDGTAFRQFLDFYFLISAVPRRLLISSLCDKAKHILLLPPVSRTHARTHTHTHLFFIPTSLHTSAKQLPQTVHNMVFVLTQLSQIVQIIASSLSVKLL